MVPRRELNVRELLELERQIYQESIDRVLQQQKELNAGTLDDYVRRCQPFETERERELQVAQNQYHLSLQDAHTLFEFDMQLANDVFQSEKEQLKRNLLESTRRQRRRIEKRLQALKEGLFDTKHSVKVRSAPVKYVKRDKAFKPDLLEKQLRRAQRKTRKSFNFRHLSGGVLPTAERIVKDVVDECDKLQRNRAREEAALMEKEEGAKNKVDVVISNDRLKVISCTSVGEDKNVLEETFEVGDAVILHSLLTDEDFQGCVSAIANEEVKLVLVCGTHVRVTFARLRTGQCVLRKQVPTSGEPFTRRKDDSHLTNVQTTDAYTTI
ncbi:hypothetical protein PsorP6_012381 [Peronosclerospora sorghi]|uniref:Uncharacterized protein n=1 Tax=Peronosclerospora sorghi TaxID=230839 RepID=A0ACC0WFT4_9STRA|nr:hypothetical protein PsorP6_012381 [Peronosclerospora sorghi]